MIRTDSTVPACWKSSRRSSSVAWKERFPTNSLAAMPDLLFQPFCEYENALKDWCISEGTPQNGPGFEAGARLLDFPQSCQVKRTKEGRRQSLLALNGAPGKKGLDGENFEMSLTKRVGTRAHPSAP